MPKYCVKFFNTLLSSDGHPRKVLQRKIEINDPESAKDAKEMAQRNLSILNAFPTGICMRIPASSKLADVPATNE